MYFLSIVTENTPASAAEDKTKDYIIWEARNLAIKSSLGLCLINADSEKPQRIYR